MSRLPTDRQVLKCIFRMYQAQYPGLSDPGGRGANDPYLSIDLRAVAKRLRCQPELVFGRLYYHLDAKYRYKQDNGAHVKLFDLNHQHRGHAVHFPYLASILAGMEQEHRRTLWSLALSIAALIVSAISLTWNIVTRWMQ